MMELRVRHESKAVSPYLVLVRSRGYVATSAMHAAATDIMYFLPTVVSLCNTLSLEMSRSA